VKDLETKLSGTKSVIDETIRDEKLFSQEQSKYITLTEKIISDSETLMEYQPKIVETEFTKAIKEIKEFNEIVPKIKTFQDGMKAVMDQRIMGMLLDTYLPLTQRMWQGFTGEFNNRLLPAVNMMMLYQRDQQIEI